MLHSFYRHIIESFDSLWSYRDRGETLEVITPFTTLTNKAVSVFLTMRNNYIFVTDGGWIDNGEYGVTLESLDKLPQRILEHYVSAFSVRTTTGGNSAIYYYKCTDNHALVATLVYDMANFLMEVVNSMLLPFREEHDNYNRFRREATDFLKMLAGPEHTVRTHSSLGKGLEGVKFNAVIDYGHHLSAIDYVTGSTDQYYLNCLSRANLDFDMLAKSRLNDTSFVKGRIILLDDTVDSFGSGVVKPFYYFIKNGKGRDTVKWSERERLHTLLT